MGRRGVNSLFKWFLPVSATRRGRGMGIRGLWLRRANLISGFSSVSNTFDDVHLLLCKKQQISIQYRSLKVPSGQIGSTWKWYHWMGLVKDINRFRFLIFNFTLGWLKSKQAGGWIHLCMKRLRTFNSNKILKITNQKPIGVDVLFNAYPMVLLSDRSNPDGT